MSDDTLTSVVKDVLRDARHNSYHNTTLTIERETLKELIREAVERGIEIGKEIGRKQALKPKKLMTKSRRGIDDIEDIVSTADEALDDELAEVRRYD